MGQISTIEEAGIVMNRVEGKTTLMELLNYIIMNVEKCAGKPALWDMTLADFSAESSTDWKSLARDLVGPARKRAGERTALVAVRDLEYGSLRMFESMAENAGLATQFRTFRDIEQAWSWLQDG